MRNKKKLLLMILIGTMIGGCASTTLQTWSNPYAKGDTLKDILELRGHPFDVNRGTNSTKLTFYRGFSKGNGWLLVPYVNMIAAGATVWITKEEIMVDAEGNYLSAVGETKKDFDQILVGAAKEIALSSNDYDLESTRTKLWMDEEGLEFDEEKWTVVRRYRRWWSTMK